MKKHVFMLNKMKTAINCKNSLFYQSIALTGIRKTAELFKIKSTMNVKCNKPFNEIFKKKFIF